VGLTIEDAGIFYGHLVYFTAIWSILRPFGLFYGHLVYFVAIRYSLHMVNWFIFPRFGKLHKEKSGNPVQLDFQNGTFTKQPTTLIKPFCHQGYAI
jgi:hypothetical protein